MVAQQLEPIFSSQHVKLHLQIVTVQRHCSCAIPEAHYIMQTLSEYAVMVNAAGQPQIFELH